MKPKKWHLRLGLLGGMAACLLSTASPVALLANPTNEPVVTIMTPAGTTITAELADTTVKRARGLMFRESLPKHHGMIFAFAEAQAWTFWMKNTRMALDLIWLDDKKTIVHIEKQVPVCTKTDDTCPQYQPNYPANYVLELAGGEADELKLQRGVKLQFQMPAP
jgi:uncharacterized membrane protein (UPF0127 family)